MSFYTRMAALNVCIARAAGIDFDKAAAVAGETIAQVSNKPLSIEELRKGSINSAVLGAVELCPNQVPDEVRKKVEEVIKSNTPKGAAPATKPAQTK